MVRAAFEGTCPACCDEITEGDFITFDEREDAWVHEACWVDPNEPAKRRAGSKPTLADRIKAGQA